MRVIASVEPSDTNAAAANAMPILWRIGPIEL
jgi:hypothetical protein